MSRFAVVLLTSCFWSTASAAAIGLGVQFFMLSGESSVNNAKLDWAISSSPSSRYEVQRSDGTSSAFRTLATVSGNTYDDYDLPSLGQSYFYQITALSDESQSNIVVVQPFSPSGTYYTYDNTQLSELVLKANLSDDGIFYRYLYQEYSNGSMSGIIQQTSTDGNVSAGMITLDDSLNNLLDL